MWQLFGQKCPIYELADMVGKTKGFGDYGKNGLLKRLMFYFRVRSQIGPEGEETAKKA